MPPGPVRRRGRMHRLVLRPVHDECPASHDRPRLRRPRIDLPVLGERRTARRRRAGDRRPRCRAGAGRREDRRGVDDAPMDQEGGASVVPPRRQRRYGAASRACPVPLLRQGADQVRPARRRGLRAGRRARRPAGGGAAWRVHREERRADAVLRQHRRLRRRRHDGRHLGDGRFVRADRQERAPLRRGRHRRRPGARAGESHDHRGQLLHRRALGGRRRRDRRGELGAGHGRVPGPEHEDLRSRDRRDALRSRAGRVGRGRGRASRGRRKPQPVLRGHREARGREDAREDVDQRTAAPVSGGGPSPPRANAPPR